VGRIAARKSAFASYSENRKGGHQGPPFVTILGYERTFRDEGSIHFAAAVTMMATMTVIPKSVVHMTKSSLANPPRRSAGVNAQTGEAFPPPHKLLKNESNLSRTRLAERTGQIGQQNAQFHLPELDVDFA
jgi:hypothetical protein